MKKMAKSRQQVANEYGISTKTLKRWMQKENLEISNGLLTPKEIEHIYKAFGLPSVKH